MGLSVKEVRYELHAAGRGEGGKGGDDGTVSVVEVVDGDEGSGSRHLPRRTFFGALVGGGVPGRETEEKTEVDSVGVGGCGKEVKGEEEKERK